jgi:hypothetical protein
MQFLKYWKVPLSNYSYSLHFTFNKAQNIFGHIFVSFFLFGCCQHMTYTFLHVHSFGKRGYTTSLFWFDFWHNFAIVKYLFWFNHNWEDINIICGLLTDRKLGSKHVNNVWRQIKHSVMLLSSLKSYICLINFLYKIKNLPLGPEKK